jgi:hypothetical protein
VTLDLLAFQMGLPGDGEGGVAQDEPSQEAAPFGGGEAQGEGPWSPLVAAGGAAELVAADLP